VVDAVAPAVPGRLCSGATCSNTSLVVDAVAPVVPGKLCSGTTCSGALLVVDVVDPVVPNCSGLSVDAQLG
jgi:hypothetical protein